MRDKICLIIFLRKIRTKLIENPNFLPSRIFLHGTMLESTRGFILECFLAYVFLYPLLVQILYF